MEDNRINNLISIILPTYNGIKYLKEAINGCLDQSYQNFELIIVDDGSSEDIKSIIDSYQNEKIRYIRNDKNIGLANSLNKGFSVAKGQYFTWISDDNKFDKNALEIFLNYFKNNPDVDFLYSNYYIIDENGNVIKKQKVKSPTSLNLGNFIGPSFIYKRKIFELIGGYDDNYKLAEDYEYWLRIWKHFKMRKLNHYLYFYRIHSRSLTSKAQKSKIASQSLKASQAYIPRWAYYFQEGVFHFYNKEYTIALNKFVHSIFINPFNIYSYYYLILIICIKMIKKSLFNKFNNYAKSYFCK